MGAVAQVPGVAVSVSPDLAAPATVGGVEIAGPPAPEALVLNAATATTAPASKTAIGRTGRRTFIVEPPVVDDRSGDTVAFRCE